MDCNTLTVKLSFLGVFDGHGGVRSASYVQKHLLDTIVANLRDARGAFPVESETSSPTSSYNAAMPQSPAENVRR